jgi:UDP-N-acetylglucosamine--dolichyl-phosphate N-acetylglucosaminephosphotransferase
MAATMTKKRFLKAVAILPLLPSLWIICRLVSKDLIDRIKDSNVSQNDTVVIAKTTTASSRVGAQLLLFIALGIMGHIGTNRLIPKIQYYMLKRGISGKDLGKKGTKTENDDIPEALGIVPGAIFLICLIFCLVGFATNHPSKLLDLNSALLSICFMLFLGFTDDVLEWPWRYKLFLPSVASLPLLCCYAGSRSVVVPIPLRFLLMSDGELTTFGRFLCHVVVVDANADGSIINLGIFYLVYMGLLAVFCTNAINIFAGINGLEVGQSYIIGCAVLFHNLVEIQSGSLSRENHVFSAMIMFSFLGVTLALLRHNWFPASVFVGDTYCYFAGMTFAVVGILGHFSKTLLLFFIPQLINFLYSIPQLFKLVPCPKHRLPKFNAKTERMEPSTITISTGKGNRERVNMTLINLFLQLLGPISEEVLCIVLLTFQVICCSLGLYFRYNLAQLIFD